MTDDPGGTNDGVAAAQSFYGRWARLYDLIATFPGVGSWRERAADSLDLSPGDRVVEMGCGTGANFPALRERVGADGHVIGVDFTRGMLDRAAERIETNGWRNVHLVRGDATAPPIDGPVDGVLSSFVVGMLTDPETAVENWCSLFGSDGRIALLDATRSRREKARPLDAAFRLFVAASTPPARQLRYSTPPWKPLDERIVAARRPLEARPGYESEAFALGFVRLSSARSANGNAVEK